MLSQIVFTLLISSIRAQSLQDLAAKVNVRNYRNDHNIFKVISIKQLYSTGEPKGTDFASITGPQSYSSKIGVVGAGPSGKCSSVWPMNKLPGIYCQLRPMKFGLYLKLFGLEAFIFIQRDLIGPNLSKIQPDSLIKSLQNLFQNALSCNINDTPCLAQKTIHPSLDLSEQWVPGNPRINPD